MVASNEELNQATRHQQVDDGKFIDLAEVDQLEVVDHELAQVGALDAVNVATLLRQPLGPAPAAPDDALQAVDGNGLVIKAKGP